MKNDFGLTPARIKKFEDNFHRSHLHLKKIAFQYERWVKRHLGPRCKKYGGGCIVCDAYHALDILKSL
jgi:hypothetical protein